MNRREFLEASAAVLLVAGCGGSDDAPVAPETLRISRTDTIVADANGTLFRARPAARTISRLDAGGAAVWTTGSYGAGPAQFDYPAELVADTRGRVLVVDRGNARVQILDAESGRYLGQFGSRGTALGQFRHPRRIAVSGDRIYVVDQLNDRVGVFAPDGTPLFAIGRAGIGASNLNVPSGVAVSADGRVYVTDGPGRGIKRFSAGGAFEARVDGGHVVDPHGLALDATGNLWVADGYAGRVVALTPQGELAQTFTARLADGRSAAPHDIALAGHDIFVRAAVNGPAAVPRA